MSDRKFFKDLTPGELQYLKSQAIAIGINPDYLVRTTDGLSKFDIYFSPEQRENLFNLLERPAVKEITIKYDQAWKAVPTLDRGTLTDADLNINPADGVFIKPVTLSADEARSRNIDGYQQIADILTPRPVVTVETQAAAEIQSDYIRLETKKTDASLLAAGQLALGLTERNDGIRIVSISDPGPFYDNKIVDVKDSRGRGYAINRDEYIATRDAFFLVVQEEENELKFFRTWAKETGLPQSEIDAVFSDQAKFGISRIAINPDYQQFLADFKAQEGKLPFATPATDAQVDRVGILLAEVEARNARTSPSGGGAADKIESTGGTDTAVTLTETERERLASAATLDELKRTYIEKGSPPIATPTQASASQSQVAAVEVVPAGNTSGNDAFFDALVDAFQKSAVKVTDSSGAGGENDVAAVQNNPLDAYESYTYGLALHVLDKSEYDNLAQNSKNWTPQHTLIASAGRWHETASAGAGDYLQREPGWEDNFYFDNLKMTQLQGPSTTGRSTNTIDMEFTIIEPYGLTLLDRMIKTATRLKEESYMHLCYMLQIDFFDSQKGQLIEHRKYLPISLTGMNIKVSGKGTQYTVQAYPFHYKALMNMIATTPLDVDVISTTLREFFADENTNDAAAGGAAAAEQIRREEQRNTPAGQDGGRPTGGTVVGSSGDYARQIAFQGSASTEKPYQIHSYVAAYNAWWKKMKDLNAVDPKIDPQNIKVRFSDEIIAQEKLTKPADAVVAQGPMANANAKQGTAPTEQNKYNGFGFKAGTGIIEVINTAMMSSQFIRSQVRIANKDESQTGNKIGTVNWWKVLPQVKLNGFDNTLNRWSYSVTYFVVPYQVWNTKHPNLPKSSPRRSQCVKQYNYLYTGDNRAIIDFQVEFDMLYFTTVAGFKNINTDRVDRKESGSKDGAEQTNPALDSNNRGSNSNSITPVVHNLVPHDASGSTGNNLTQDPVAIALGTIQDSIYSGVNGEMLTVHMKIIGDPTLLKQDDLFINIGQYYDPSRRSQSSDGILLKSSHHNGDTSLNNNSIVTDAGEVLAWVQVLMPPDIDENTGGLRRGAGASSVNSFTGVYKIMEVQNEFSQGKFIQTLVLIRYQEQDADNDYRQALAIERERIKSDINNDAGVTPGNFARSSDQDQDAVVPDPAKNSSQITTVTAGASEESNLPQTALALPPATQFNLLDSGIFPESVIEPTDLA